MLKPLKFDCIAFLKGKAMLVKNLSEMQDLDKPCILLQIRSELDEK